MGVLEGMRGEEHMRRGCLGRGYYFSWGGVWGVGTTVFLCRFLLSTGPPRLEAPVERFLTTMMMMMMVVLLFLYGCPLSQHPHPLP